MLSPIENVTKVWHGYGTGFGGYCKGLVPYYGTEACAIPMARWQARVQNHTLEKNSSQIAFLIGRSYFASKGVARDTRFPA